MDADHPLDHYRPNVGVVLFNPDGLVWLGRRVRTPGPYNWQFPQGGIDPGEDWEAAARRELLEETGVSSADLLAATPDWITYDFPPGHGGSKAARGYRGQKQKWFAFRFTGDESEIDLERHGDLEFDAWRWGRLDEVRDLIVPFKRTAYGQVIAAFARFAAP